MSYCSIRLKSHSSTGSGTVGDETLQETSYLQWKDRSKMCLLLTGSTGMIRRTTCESKENRTRNYGRFTNILLLGWFSSTSGPAYRFKQVVTSQDYAQSWLDRVVFALCMVPVRQRLSDTTRSICMPQRLKVCAYLLMSIELAT